MELKQLSIHNFRNLSSVSVSPGSGFNQFYGENGAGKTSVLEAIYLLSHGRSFRGSSPRDLIQYDKPSLVVRGETSDGLTDGTLGIERTPSSTEARLNGNKVKAISTLSVHLPVQTVHPGSFNLLTGEPSNRRAFLDWGLFFTDNQFRSNWVQYKRALSQRNAAIKKHLSIMLIQSWDSILVSTGNYITAARKTYLSDLQSALPEYSEYLGEDCGIDLTYRQGWVQTSDLEKEFQHNIERDRKLGFTYGGPHRADFGTKYFSKDVAKYASRGQIKHVTLLLKLVQTQDFVQNKNKNCILLLDDLGSELDKARLAKVMRAVSMLKLQTFITAVEKATNAGTTEFDLELFHVKHGNVEPV